MPRVRLVLGLEQLGGYGILCHILDLEQFERTANADQKCCADGASGRSH